MKTEKVVVMLNGLAEKIGGFVRLSKKGVPHIVVERGGRTYSVCYFASTNTFRVFWPYPSYGAVQSKKTVANEEAVIKLLAGVR